MKHRADELRMTYNQLYKEQDDIYRSAAVKAKLSDAAYWTMYMLRESEEEVTQSSLSKEWFFTKQTINSAVANLVKKGYVVLQNEVGKGNRKALVLAEEGERFCEEYVDPLIRAEQNSFDALTEAEQELVIHLMKKQLKLFKEGMEYAAD